MVICNSKLARCNLTPIKTNAGKSSVANSILGADVYKMDVGMGAEVKADGIIDYGKWRIIDSPGFMYSSSDNNQALQEIQRSHGRIFVVDSEPFEPSFNFFLMVEVEGNSSIYISKLK
ncbi:MAG: 50S ribosome-binding GTPase [Cyanomargarita calcarea GSE-NOS-MK-12-04C]|uniref:50S ribosome-binding GTPase n=1 Tax=Cyanomargarita calcarea GSE-NOS-MK-12-04C TaxID=2839659 RepID=A0A951QKL9_9CYAN|nr:50S ribosome-binding GTPase [Cyanomargarita calcarea GSE-NOS-MK-12-04C]